MKTLSARIRGSKSELVELGEDIEFLSEGTSKLRNEIKSLSGVDIMIDKNNFKSTYQIIDELSTAYQGMVETSQARLAELLGGKNQANIVSALLENFDVARNTLRDSTDKADGSAEKELATSLDSINGKVAQLSATWQKFSTDFLESDTFKAVIDGANKFLQILDALIGDSHSLIKLAPLVLAGFGIAKNKSGLNLLKGLIPKSGLSRSELQSQLADYYIEVEATASMTREQYFSQFTDNSRDILHRYVDSIDDINTASVDGIVAYQNHALSEMNAGFTKYLGVLKNVGANLLMMLGTELAIRLGEWIWGNLSFTQAHKDKISKLAEEATSAFNDALDKNASDTATIKQMTDEFQKLSSGVSRTGENLSLTNDQYSAYKSYVEQLIKINPTLVEGINAQGEAFINNKTAIEETLEMLKEQQRAIYAGFFNGSDNEAVLEDLVNKRKEKVAEIYDDIDYAFMAGFGKDDSSSLLKLKGILGEAGWNQLAELTKKNEEVAKLIGLNANENFSEVYSEADEDRLFELTNKILSNREKILELARETRAQGNWGTPGGESRDFKVLSQQFTDIENIYTEATQRLEQLEAIDQEFDEYVDKFAKSRSEYWDLSSSQTALVDKYIQDYNFFDRITKDGADEKAVETQMRSDVMKFLKFLSGLSEDINNNVVKITALDKSSISYSSYRQQVNDIISQIVNDPTYNKELLPEENLRVVLGVDFETNEGEIENEYENMIKNIINRFQKNRAKQSPLYDSGAYKNELDKKIREQLTPDQISKLYASDNEANFTNWNNALNFLNEIQKFDIATYQDSIDAITKDLSTLGDALKKVKLNELRLGKQGSTEEVMNLVKAFPELAKYVDYNEEHFGELEKGLIDLINVRPDKLLDMFETLGDLSEADKAEVDNLRKAIKNLQKDALGKSIGWLVREGLTEQDYLNYVMKDYDKIIKKLEKEKEGVGEVNESLEKQKEELEKIIDQYKIAGDTVVKTLDKKITDVTDYYDEQINKLKEENEEIEQNIDLQKKMDALVNARKTKVRVYNETQGWHFESDSAAITDAEQDLAKTQREIKVAELEKQRDQEIELWEDYKEAWQEAMDEYTNAHDEAITDGILGSDWRDNVMNRDETMLENYRVNYSNFQSNLNNSIDKQIEANEKYIKSIDDKIKKYQDDKEEMQSWVDDLNNEKLRYFDLIDDISITEQSSWTERLSNMEEFKENYRRIMREIRAANSEEVIPETPTLKIRYSGGDSSIEKDPILQQEFDSESSAESMRHALAKKIRAKRIAGLPANLRTKEYLAEMLEEILASLEIEPVGSYAKGGVIDSTGLAQVHGSSGSAEVALNSSQAKTVYDFIASGIMAKATTAMTAAYNALIDALPSPVLNGDNMPKIAMHTPDIDNGKSQTSEINISFPNATINAKDYDSFKGFMDRYTNDLLLKMQVGL